MGYFLAYSESNAPCLQDKRPKPRSGLLTDRYQTTVPEAVRRALKLGKRDKIHYTIRPSGVVVLTRAEASEGDDPVLGQFLEFLAPVAQRSSKYS